MLVFLGAHDEAIKRVEEELTKTSDQGQKAKLHLVRCQAYHSKAGVPKTLGFASDQEKTCLMEAYYSSLVSSKYFEKLNEEDRESFVALEATLLARLSILSRDQDSCDIFPDGFRLNLLRAYQSTQRAAALQQGSTKARFQRVLGLLSLSLSDFAAAQKHFKEAILEFKRCGEEEC